MTPERESLERDVAGMRTRRSVTGVWMAAVFGFGWLAAGYAIGIVKSMLIDFVPDATQTITPLLLVPPPSPYGRTGTPCERCPVTLALVISGSSPIDRTSLPPSPSCR